jgi:hypothetical protein
MTHATRKSIRLAVAIAAGLLCLSVNEDIWQAGSKGLVTEATARIGRPLTPLSYAGVARRTTRRAVAVGAAVGGACYQVVNAYGQIVTRCY